MTCCHTYMFIYKRDSNRIVASNFLTDSHTNTNPSLYPHGYVLIMCTVRLLDDYALLITLKAFSRQWCQCYGNNMAHSNRIVAWYLSQRSSWLKCNVRYHFAHSGGKKKQTTFLLRTASFPRCPPADTIYPHSSFNCLPCLYRPGSTQSLVPLRTWFQAFPQNLVPGFPTEPGSRLSHGAWFQNIPWSLVSGYPTEPDSRLSHGAWFQVFPQSIEPCRVLPE